MWGPQALDFLRDLEANNDRDWFKSNRPRYDEELVAPAQELAASLSHLGEPHFFRPFRDTRFRPGPPIKEELGVVVMAAGGAAYYFQLSLDGLLVAGGIPVPQSDQLERFRASIVEDRSADAFEQAIATAAAAGLVPPEPALKRAPRGYPADHPRVDRLRLKSLTVSKRHPPTPWLHTTACDEAVGAELEAARPLIDWLAANVGQSSRGRSH
ncbi:MAG: DUF2461 domain-containing protein [Solirubrobacteraceae bacterium]